MNYVGIDWAYGRAAWCALARGGQIEGEGLIPADEDGLARLALEARDRGQGLRRGDERRDLGQGPARARRLVGRRSPTPRKVRDVAPLACKTDKVDARVLAELCRRELGPRGLGRLARRPRDPRAPTPPRPPGQAAYLGPQPHLRPADPVRSADLVHAPAPARRDRAARAPRRPGGLARLDRRAPRPRSKSSTGASTRLTASCGPIARSDPRARLLQTIPGVGPLISLTFARRSARSRALPQPQSSSAMPALRRGSASRVNARRPAHSQRRARGPCAGLRSRPPTRPGGRPIPSTSTTGGSPSATARTRRSRRSPASS